MNGVLVIRQRIPRRWSRALCSATLVALTHCGGGTQVKRTANAVDTPPPPSMLAVLEVHSFLDEAEQKSVPSQFFSDLVRGYAHNEAPDLKLMTRENILLLLPNGEKDLADCEAGCEVETGRRIGADLIITGELRRVGNLNLQLRIHDTRTALLLQTALAEGKDAVELKRNVGAAVASLFSSLNLGGGHQRAAFVPGDIQSSGGILDREKRLGVLVNFSSTPAAAIVRVDNELVCAATPCERQVTAGLHSVRMEKEGFHEAVQSSELREGEEVNLSLAPRFALIDVTTIPDGLGIKINGVTHSTPLRQLQLPAGDYNIVANDPCYQAEGKALILKEGDQEAVEISPRAHLAVLKAVAHDTEGNDVHADLSIGGRSIGQAPLEVTVPSCTRSLVASDEQGRTATATLDLHEGETRDVVLELRHQGPSVAECDDGVSRWPWWTGGTGLAVWAGAGGGALLVKSQLSGLQAGDPSVDSKRSTGTALMIVSNVGAAIFGVAAIKLLGYPDHPHEINPACHAGVQP